MAVTTSDDPPPSTTAALPQILASGLVVASLAAIYAISGAVLLFTGPVEALRPAGIVALMTGSVIYGLAGGLFGSQPAAWWGNQNICIAVLALGAEAHLLSATDLGTEVQSATMLAYLMAATVLTGLAFLLVGMLRIANVLRIIPLPVIGGFLAATGLYLAYSGARLATGADGPSQMVHPEALLRWGPVLAGALALLALQRARPKVQYLIPALALVILGVHLYLWTNGVSVDVARAEGLMMDAPGALALPGTTLGPGTLASVDTGVLIAATPTLLACAALAALGVLINTSGVELISGERPRLNHDFRRCGGANVIVGLAGGVPGFQSASTIPLMITPGGGGSRLISYAAAGTLVLLLLGGLPLIGYVPKLAVACLLVYIGAELLWRWLLSESRVMTWADRGIVWLILVSTLLFGFATAIAIGLVLSTILFAVAYSRIDVLRSVTSGAERFSGTERGADQIALLTSTGADTRILELQGYLFFGTAERLYARISDLVEAPSARPARLIIDFRRVAGLDASAARMFQKIARLARDRQVTLAFSELPADTRAQLSATGASDGVEEFPSLSEALVWAEETALAGSSARNPRVDPDLSDILARIDAAMGPGGLLRRSLSPGETLFHEGAPSDSLGVLESGILVATISRADGAQRQVARFLPGAVVGEIGLYTGTKRTATVTADTASVVVELPSKVIAEITRTDPELAAELHQSIARLLGKRLGRTTALVFAIDH